MHDQVPLCGYCYTAQCQQQAPLQRQIVSCFQCSRRISMGNYAREEARHSMAQALELAVVGVLLVALYHTRSEAAAPPHCETATCSAVLNAAKR